MMKTKWQLLKFGSFLLLKSKIMLWRKLFDKLADTIRNRIQKYVLGPASN